MASTAGLRLEKLGVIQQTVNTWISDIRARQKVGRNVVIFRLNRLGWTQEQIAEKAGVNQQRVSQITNNTKFGDIGNLIAQGHDPDNSITIFDYHRLLSESGLASESKIRQNTIRGL